MGRILVGIDGPALSMQALRRAARPAHRERDPLQAVTAWVNPVLEGPSARVRVETAKDADLLIAIGRDHRGSADVMLGPVSLPCVSHAAPPVAVVRGQPKAE